MNKEGKYIYSIIKENKEKNFGPIGINNREVGLIHWKDIAAVVSNSPLIKFNRLGPKELSKHIATHQRVNEGLLKTYDVVPMAFGIIAPSASEVERILKKTYLQFKTALAKVEDKVEFVVQVFCNPKKLLEGLAITDPEIKKLKQGPKKSILGLPAKLRLGKLIQEKAEAQREAYIKDIEAHLKNSSCRFVPNRLVKNDKWNEEEMIANFSFLIEQIKESEFDKGMNELGRVYDGKLRFKYIGPMPPYSFTDINLGLGNFELLDEARKLLELSEEASFDEIKKAYYRLAHQYHPDKHSQKEDLMKKIAQAYSVLENYCQSCGQKQKYSFREEDVKKAVLVR